MSEIYSYCESPVDRILFGKYKNRLVSDIMDFDARYILWLHKTSTRFTLSGPMLRRVVEKAQAQHDFIPF